MPHPRIAEGDITAPPVATAVTYELDGQAEIVSDISYKDLGRHYTDVVSVGTATSASSSKASSATPLRRIPQQPFGHAPSHPSNSAAADQQEAERGATVSKISMDQTASSGTSSSYPPLSLAQQQTWATAFGDVELQSATGNIIIEHKSHDEADSENRCLSEKMFVILVAVGVLLLGCVVGVAVGLVATREKSTSLPPANILKQVPSPLRGERDSRFGYSLSTNGQGTRLAVADQTCAYIYEHDGNLTWNDLGAKIEAPPNTTNLVESDSVLIRAPVIVKMSADGQSVAVGWSSFQENRGTVQVYRYNQQDKEWKTHGQPIVGAAPDYYYGASLDLSEDGSVLVVGAPGRGGLVSIYRFNTGAWQDYGTQILKQDIGGLTITSVALARDGQKLAFGGVAGTAETVARIFKFDVGSGDWSEMGSGLQSSRGGTAYMVDLSGDGLTVAISNYYYLESNPGKNNDALDVRAYQWSEKNDAWTQLGDTLHASSPGAKSGYFISLSDDGHTMVMGDPGRIGDTGGGNTGHSHVYMYGDGSWSQLGPNILGEAAGDNFGYDIVVSGDGKRFAASAPYSRSRGTEYPHGQVLVFEIPSV